MWVCRVRVKIIAGCCSITADNGHRWGARVRSFPPGFALTAGRSIRCRPSRLAAHSLNPETSRSWLIIPQSTVGQTQVVAEPGGRSVKRPSRPEWTLINLSVFSLFLSLSWPLRKWDSHSGSNSIYSCCNAKPRLKARATHLCRVHGIKLLALRMRWITALVPVRCFQRAGGPWQWRLPHTDGHIYGGEDKILHCGWVSLTTALSCEEQVVINLFFLVFGNCLGALLVRKQRGMASLRITTRTQSIDDRLAFGVVPSPPLGPFKTSGMPMMLVRQLVTSLVGVWAHSTTRDYIRAELVRHTSWKSSLVLNKSSKKKKKKKKETKTAVNLRTRPVTTFTTLVDF